MATLEQLQQALIAADKAGATEDAKALAQAIMAVKSRPEATAKPAAVLEDDPGFMQTVLIGAGRAADRISKGTQQAYYNARSAIAPKSVSDLVTGGNEWDRKLAKLKSEAEEDDRLYKPLQDARPWATGIGEALPSLAVPMGAPAGLLAKMGTAAAAGAIPSALEYGTLEERMKNAGRNAMFSAAVPLAGATLKAGVSLVEPLWNGGREAIASRLLKRVAGNDAAAVQAKLRGAQELVPGSAPTAAQVAENGGIAALERAVSQADPEAYAKRAMDQSFARKQALQGIAKDEAALAAAKAEREAASGSLYAAADVGVAPVDGFFKGLMLRGQFKDAVNRAKELANNEGLSDIFFRDKNGNPTALIGQGAHYIKKALDEAAEAGSSSYTGKAGATAAGKTNRLFQEWLDKSIPEYAQAKAAFAKKSAPINQMQIGQELYNKMAPALTDYGALARDTGNTFARALRDADATAAKATGMTSAKMADVLTPQQMATVEGVAKDLARKANAQDLGRGVGSNTFQNFAMDNIAAQSGMPRLTGGLLGLPGVSRAVNWTYQETDSKLKGLLAEALLDPAKAAELMAKTDPKILASSPKLRELLTQSAKRSAGLLSMSAPSAPAALSASQQ